MQNIFIVPAMQHGCRAKPLYFCKSFRLQQVSRFKIGETLVKTTFSSFQYLRIYYFVLRQQVAKLVQTRFLLGASPKLQPTLTHPPPPFLVNVASNAT